MPIELLVEKPFRITRQFEFMVAVGPKLVPFTGDNEGAYFGGLVAVDFRFWQSREIGLRFSPRYHFVFRDGVAHGFGATMGLLVGW